jgi:hypothetical protein
MKKSLLFILFLLVSINFVSAYGFSLGDFFEGIDSSTMILGAVFIISFYFINLALSRFFKDRGGGPSQAVWVPSLAAALLITWGINKTGFDISGFFFDIGISEELLMTILPILILAGAILLIIKLKSGSLLVFGGLFILLSFLAYDKTLLITIGIILLVIGVILLGRKKKDEYSIPIRRR